MDPRRDYEDEPSFWERYRVLIGVGLFVLIGAALAVSCYLLAGKPSKPRIQEPIAIHLLPPPPAPPPPPPPPPPKIPPPVQKMVEQPPVKPDEVKPKDVKAPDRPPGPPGPPAGPATDDGIGGNGGGGGGDGDGGGGGSKYGYYANEVVQKITSAVHENSKTRDATAHVKVRLWVDNTGRVTRAKLADSSDDPTVDTALQNEVLTGMTMPEAPPADMPMPIVLLLSEVRPN